MHPVVVGDMILSSKQYDYLYSNSSSKRHGLRLSINHWTKGVVPYTFADDINADVKRITLEAMDYIANVSCVRFKVANRDENYVKIRNGHGCSSNVGNLRKGVQFVTLSVNCRLGNIIHEFLHSLGFLHMHTAIERDEYVRVDYDNIMPGLLRNFEKYTTYVSMFKTPYDYGSIMHYSRGAFALDKTKPTIDPKEDAPTMGQRKGKMSEKFEISANKTKFLVEMSEGDVLRLNRMYKCNTGRSELETEEEEENEEPGTQADDANDESADEPMMEELITINDDLSMPQEDEYDQRFTTFNHHQPKYPRNVFTMLQHSIHGWLQALKPISEVKKQMKEVLGAIRNF